METSDIEVVVNKHYSDLAKKVRENQKVSCCDSNNSCCDNDENSTSPSFGCNSNLIDQAEIKKGQVVIDFGSGPAHDAILAVEQVGSHGRVIGVDFSEEMILLGRENAKKAGLTNLEFIKAKITNIPLPDGIADIIISNCVVNLVEQKSEVFDEAYRLLRPGGKVVISDMITTGTVTEYKDELMCACIGGATSSDQYVQMLEESGFRNIDHTTTYASEIGYLDIKVPYISVTFVAYK